MACKMQQSEILLGHFSIYNHEEFDFFPLQSQMFSPGKTFNVLIFCLKVF